MKSRHSVPNYHNESTLENELALSLDVQAALQGAPPLLRAVALLLSQAYTESEIASFLGISRQKVWRLRQQLRRVFEHLITVRRGGEQHEDSL